MFAYQPVKGYKENHGDGGGSGKVSVTSLLLLLLIGSTFALTGCGGLSEFDEFGIL
jgi:hypothetical protein